MNISQLPKGSFTPVTPKPPAGGLNINNLPQGSYTPVQPQQSPSVGGFLGNAVSSAGNFVGGIGQAVMHPIQTAENLGGAIYGAGQEIGGAIQGKQISTPETQKWDNILNFYKQRYGSPEQFLQTMYKDPVGFLADASTLASGLGGAVGAVGDLADASKVADVGEAIGRTGEAINPVSLAGKALSPVVNVGNKLAATAFGIPSKLGYSGANDVINAARGVEGAPDIGQMTDAAREGVDTQQVATELNGVYNKIRKTQLNDYSTGLENIDQNYRETNLSQKGNSNATVMQNNKLPEFAAEAGQTAGETFPLSTQGIKGVMTRVLADHNISFDPEGKIDLTNSPIADTEATRLQKIYDNVQNWKDTTPQGLKNLTRKIGGYFKPLAKDDEVNSIIQGMKSNLNGYLREKVPEFKELDNTYRQTSKLLNGEKGSATPNLRQTFGLGPKSTATADTIVNRVLKAANSDDAYTQGLVKTLENTTGRDFQAIATGKLAQGWTPKGLIAGGLEVGTLIHPQLALGLLMSSPRVSFEFLRGLGLGEAKIADISQGLQLGRATLLANRVGALSSASAQNPNPQASQAITGQQQKSPSLKGVPQRRSIRVRKTK